MNFYVHPELVDYEGVVTQACPLLARFELDGGKVLLYAPTAAPVPMATGSTVHVAQVHALCRTTDQKTILVCCDYSSVRITNGVSSQGISEKNRQNILKVGFRGLLWLEELSLLLRKRSLLEGEGLHNNPLLLENVIDFFFGNQKSSPQRQSYCHKCSAFDEGLSVPSAIGSVCEVVAGVQKSAQWEPFGHKFTVATGDDRLLLGTLGGDRLGDAGGSVPLLLPTIPAPLGLVALQNWVLVGGKQLRAQHLRLLEESLEQQMEALSLNPQEPPFPEICSIRDLYKSLEEMIAFTGVLEDTFHNKENVCLVLRDGTSSGSSVRVYVRSAVGVMLLPGSHLRLCPLRVRTSRSTGALYLQATQHTRITHLGEVPLCRIFRRLLCVDRVVVAHPHQGHTVTLGAGAWRIVCCGREVPQQITSSKPMLIDAHCLLLPQPKTVWCQKVNSISTHRAALHLYAELCNLETC